MVAPTIDVFAEIVCPFAHVGLRRFIARRAQAGAATPRLRVRAWPLELVNGRPFDPDAVARHVEELRRQVAPDLFGRFDASSVPRSSLPAFGLVAEAYLHGDDLGEQVSLAIRTALFEDGQDVSDAAVLATLAHAHGIGTPSILARHAFQADYEEGRRRGVRGSPHFFVGDHEYFCPSLSIDRHGDEVTITPAPERLGALLADCFA
jgi:predicted DsbA family dithiol-disulfide isomerase